MGEFHPNIQATLWPNLQAEKYQNFQVEILSLLNCGKYNVINLTENHYKKISKTKYLILTMCVFCQSIEDQISE